MKVLLLTSNSIQNMALSHMLSKQHELVGIVYENRFSGESRVFNYLKKVNYNPLKIIEKLYQKYRLRYLESSLVTGINEGYRDYSTFYGTSILEVTNINQKESVEFIKNTVHDIIIVSGTRMVKKEILSLRPEYGIINMHTGLSPYYNGGPSCTFWCLYNEDVEYIGATVMFIDEGIDSGNIILTDTISLNAVDSYGQMEFKAIDLGNHLILKALEKLVADKNFRGYKQNDIASGHIYYNKDYTFSKRVVVQNKMKDGTISKLITNKQFDKNIRKFTD
jgi:methionyl-tRNA formyltransferase